MGQPLSRTGDAKPFAHARHWFRTRVLDSRYVADPEWLIGLGRLVTASFAVIAIQVEPTRPGRFFDEAWLFTMAYFVFALLALIPIRRPVDSGFHLLTHLVDILVIGWLLHLTDELTSPFFAFFHYLLFAATIRWGMVGALLGALVLEAIMLLTGLPDLETGRSELNIFIMKSGYFVVAAFMLGYLGAYRSRSRNRLARLAASPDTPLNLRDHGWLADILAPAIDVLGAARLVVIWQDIDEPAGMVAVFDHRGLRVSAISDPAAWAPIGTALDDRDPRGTAHDANQPLALAQALASQGITATVKRSTHADFASIRYSGRLYVIDARYPDEEIGSLGGIIASRIGYELERMALMQEVSNTARVQERVRLARDLHDSVLQDLTAARLKLKGAARLVPETVAPLIEDADAIVAEQQKRIRQFVDGIRGDDDRASALPVTLSRQVEQLKRRWDCEIHLTTHPSDFRVSNAMADNLHQIISEATSNAVRHGDATRIDLSLALRGDTLYLDIADNGTRSTGNDDAEPRRPISLGARVADLAGRLSVLRRRPGFVLLIELPAT